MTQSPQADVRTLRRHAKTVDPLVEGTSLILTAKARPESGPQGHSYGCRGRIAAVPYGV
jgi:hypothetical protein